jgi:hypothetical protein
MQIFLDVLDDLVVRLHEGCFFRENTLFLPVPEPFVDRLVLHASVVTDFSDL